MVPVTSAIFNQVARLIARKDFIKVINELGNIVELRMARGKRRKFAVTSGSQ
jgi:hypothetical protein